MPLRINHYQLDGFNTVYQFHIFIPTFETIHRSASRYYHLLLSVYRLGRYSAEITTFQAISPHIHSIFR